VEKKHNPIKSQDLFYKITDGYYLIFLSFVLEAVLWGVKGDQRNRNVP
jgi:hypothetical protein